MKPRKTSLVVDSVEDLIDCIQDGMTLVVPADYGGSPAEAARALVRKGVKNLRLIGGPPSGYVAELLIGAGCVSYLEMPGVILGDFGLAPRFREAVSQGKVEIRDSTCPAFHAAINAAQRGLPFMPMRGLIGSDVLRYRPEWQVISNPYAGKEADDPIVLIPALVPDVVLFHAIYGDRYGNVWIGKSFEVMAMAQAAKMAIATFEHFFEGDLLEDKHMAPSTISHIYMSATAHVERGAWPLALGAEYPVDAEHMKRYVELARTRAGFDRYVDEVVRGKQRAA